MRIYVGRGALIAHNRELSAPAHTTVHRGLKVVAQISRSYPPYNTCWNITKRLSINLLYTVAHLALVSILDLC